MTNHPAAQSNPILEQHPPALLRLWTVSALPLNANVVIRQRNLLAHVATLGVPGIPEAAHGNAAMASRLELSVMHDDEDRCRGTDLAAVAPLRESGMIRIAHFQALPDLHLDSTRPSSNLASCLEVDAVIVDGGAFVGPALAFSHLRALPTAPLPIVAVLGNREFWGGIYQDRLAELRACAHDHGIIVLHNEAIVIAGVRVLGTTQWTDYALHGDKLRFTAMEAARTARLDHRRIAWTNEPGRLFGPEEAAVLHAEARRFLNDTLGTPFTAPAFVVMHHAPHPTCCAPRFIGALLDAADASELSDLVAVGRPVLWVHGYVHRSVDLLIGATRILANPRGQGGDHPDFDPALVVEVGATGPPCG